MTPCRLRCLLAVLWFTPTLGQSAVRAANKVNKKSSTVANTTGRFDVGQTLGTDTRSDRVLSYTDLRATFDVDHLLKIDQLQFVFDGRVRYTWDNITNSRYAITRMYLEYGQRANAWFASVGRQTLTTIFGAEVDGARIGLHLGKHATISTFGGFAPHPLTGNFNGNFGLLGIDYDWRSQGQRHSGGWAFQFYKGSADRIYFSHQSFARLTKRWSLVGFLVLDMMAPIRLSNQATSSGSPQQDNGSRVDITRGHLRVNYRPNAWLNFSGTLGHTHTILPNQWWADYLSDIRKQRGLTLEGQEPFGSRLTTLRFTANLRLTEHLRPYVRFRYDRRHSPGADGFESRVGLKCLLEDLYIDVHYRYRPHFRSVDHLVALQSGMDFSNRWGIDAGTTGMLSQPMGADKRNNLLLDIHGALWWRPEMFGNGVDGVRFFAQYQGFAEVGVMTHIGMLLMGYRL